MNADMDINLVETSLSIVDIQETKFKYNTEYDYSRISLDTLGLYVQFKLSADMDNEKMGLDVTVSYGEIDTNNVLVEVSTLLVFSISNLKNVTLIEGNEIKSVSSLLIKNLLSVSLGTLRGILYVRLKGTPLEKYALPLFSDKELDDISRNGNVH